MSEQEIGVWTTSDESISFIEAVPGLSQRGAAKFLLQEVMGAGEELAALPTSAGPFSIIAHEHDDSFKGCKGGKDCPKTRKVQVWSFEVWETSEMSPEDRDKAYVFREGE